MKPQPIHNTISIFLLGLFLTASFLVGCGGGGGSTTPPPPTGGGSNLTGTAAKGAAIASATVTVKDKNGTTKTGTTDANGKYTIDVTGLTAPFLLKVDLPGGTSLYSVGSAVGVVNIHPFTDLIIQTWYEVQGKTVEAGFADPVTNPAPDTTTVQTIAKVVKEVIQTWLVSSGIDPANFDLIATPFDANSAGFDAVLDRSTVNPDGTVSITDGTVIQTTTVTIDPVTGSATVSTTTTDGTHTSSSVTSTVIPATSEQQAALQGVQNTLSQLAAAVNGKGNLLADSDLIGFFDPSYRENGDNRNIGAAELATGLRGITINSFTVDRILSHNVANKVISIAGIASLTAGGVTIQEVVDEEGEGLIFKGQPDGSWLFFGNQRIARVDADIQMENRMDPSCTGCNGPQKVLHLQEEAEVGAISAVAVAGGGADYTLTKNTLLSVDTLEPTPGVFLDITRERFDLCPPTCTSLSAFPPAGTVYTFTVTPATGSPVTYTDTIGASTTETIAITSLATGDGAASVNDHTLASVKGKTVTVQWTLPKTFPVAEVEVRAFVVAGANGCDVEGDTELPATATSGTITIPTHCGGAEIVSLGSTGPVPVSISAVVTGVHGEETHAWFPFR